MSETFRFVLAAILCAAGLAVILTSILGVFRFRFVLNRMHCAAIIDTLGTLILLTGLMIASAAPAYVLKLLGILLFLWIGSPIASHLLSRMELLTDKDALNHMEHPREAEEDPDGVL